MNKNVKINNPMKVITGPDTRWSYANVWEPKSINGGTPKYSVSLIIPKSDTKNIAKIEAAIEAAYKEGGAKLKGNGKSVPALSVIKTPLRDGDMDRPDNPAYANAYFVNANATSSPGIVDADRNPILTRSEVYSGVYGRASISFYAFNSSGNSTRISMRSERQSETVMRIPLTSICSLLRCSRISPTSWPSTQTLPSLTARRSGWMNSAPFPSTRCFRRLSSCGA